MLWCNLSRTFSCLHTSCVNLKLQTQNATGINGTLTMCVSQFCVRGELDHITTSKVKGTDRQLNVRPWRGNADCESRKQGHRLQCFTVPSFTCVWTPSGAFPPGLVTWTLQKSKDVWLNATYHSFSQISNYHTHTHTHAWARAAVVKAAFVVQLRLV